MKNWKVEPVVRLHAKTLLQESNMKNWKIDPARMTPDHVKGDESNMKNWKVLWYWNPLRNVLLGIQYEELKVSWASGVVAIFLASALGIQYEELKGLGVGTT